MDNQAVRKQCLRRWSALGNEISPWLDDWRQLSRMVLPRRGRFLSTDRSRGGRRNRAIINNTATLALRTLAAGLMGGITSPARPWFRLATRQPGMMEDGEVKAFLSDTEHLLLEIFDKSNLYDSLACLYEELVAFGSAPMMIYEDFDDVINCETLTAGQYRVAPNRKGQIGTLYRSHSLTVEQLVEEFCPGYGEDRDFSRVSKKVAEDWRKGNLDGWNDVLQAIEQNPDYRPGPGLSENKLYRSVWIELGGKDDALLRVKGFDERPFVCPRWNLTPGDTYATGPAMDALGDTEQLQAEEKEKSLAIQKVVRPPLNAPSSISKTNGGIVNSAPDSVTWYDGAGPGSVGATPAYSANPQIGELRLDMADVQQRIRNAFYVDLWLMISESNRSGVTATEVDAKREEKMLMLGPVLERLHHDMLGPLIDRAFAIASRADILPRIPQALSGQPLQVRYTSVLAQAQRAVATGAIERMVAFVGNLAAADQAVLDKLDRDQTVDEYADAIGAPPRLIIDDATVQQKRLADAKRAQAQQQMDALSLAADKAKVLSQADTGGRNALTDILNNVTGAMR
jgi:hypothetical protein